MRCYLHMAYATYESPMLNTHVECDNLSRVRRNVMEFTKNCGEHTDTLQRVHTESTTINQWDVMTMLSATAVTYSRLLLIQTPEIVIKHNDCSAEIENHSRAPIFSSYFVNRYVTARIVPCNRTKYNIPFFAIWIPRILSISMCRYNVHGYTDANITGLLVIVRLYMFGALGGILYIWKLILGLPVFELSYTMWNYII